MLCKGFSATGRVAPGCATLDLGGRSFLAAVPRLAKNILRVLHFGDQEWSPSQARGEGGRIDRRATSGKERSRCEVSLPRLRQLPRHPIQHRIKDKRVLLSIRGQDVESFL